MRIPPHPSPPTETDELALVPHVWIIKHPSGYTLHISREGDFCSAGTDIPDEVTHITRALLLTDLIRLGQFLLDRMPEASAGEAVRDRRQELAVRLGEIEAVLHNALIDTRTLLRELE